MTAAEKLYSLPAASDSTVEESISYLEGEFVTSFDKNPSNNNEKDIDKAIEMVENANGTFSAKRVFGKLYKQTTSSLEKRTKGFLNENLKKIYELQASLKNTKNTLEFYQDKLSESVSLLQKDVRGMSTELTSLTTTVDDIRKQYNDAYGHFQKFENHYAALEHPTSKQSLKYKIFSQGVTNLKQKCASQELKLAAKEAYYVDVVDQLKLQKEDLVSVYFNLELVENEMKRLDHAQRQQEAGSPLAILIGSKKISNDMLELDRSITENLKMQRTAYNSIVTQVNIEGKRKELQANRSSIEDIIMQ